MKTGLVAAVALFVLGVLLALVQLWFAVLSPEVFVKLEMSLGGLLLIVGVVGFAVKEVRADKATRSGKLDL